MIEHGFCFAKFLEKQLTSNILSNSRTHLVITLFDILNKDQIHRRCPIWSDSLIRKYCCFSQTFFMSRTPKLRGLCLKESPLHIFLFLSLKIIKSSLSVNDHARFTINYNQSMQILPWLFKLPKNVIKVEILYLYILLGTPYNLLMVPCWSPDYSLKPTVLNSN